MKAVITEEMKARASLEAKKRDAHIQHHFQVNHLSYEERDQIGFIGEFACCNLLGIDWKKNIREDYKTIDNYDFIIKGLKADVKTETVPLKYAQKILKRTIDDNRLYGRRLIHKGQFSLLKKYDIIIFGLIIRDHLDFWYPIGYIDTKTVLANYPPVFKRPDGGHYPFPGSPVPTSILKPLDHLI